MKITTLENGDRLLELSEYERDILIQVAEYLRDNYDDLEFAIREFTPEDVEYALDLLAKFDLEQGNVLTKDNLFTLMMVFGETSQFLGGVSWYAGNTQMIRAIDDFWISILNDRRLEK